MASTFGGTGRRKTAVARVTLADGSGRLVINKREGENYFPLKEHRQRFLAPMEATNTVGKFDVTVNVRGGGIKGQADAVRLGVARALAKAGPEYEKALREQKFMTRDSRVKERKKYGRRGARRGIQFSKR